MSSTAEPQPRQMVLAAINFSTKEKASEFIEKAEALHLKAYRLANGDQVWKIPDATRDEYQCCFVTTVPPAEPKDLAQWGATVQLLCDHECLNHTARELTFEQTVVGGIAPPSVQMPRYDPDAVSPV